ncbi:UNVERIFIED_CONTAM: COP9 signalosome complex subunit 7a [Siphonaria sp. JEL0065]|nr:COP9 signalosome complex subunit 7a [Siphonaria sp. JEL0065]
MYQSIVEGKLDQKNNVLRVENAMGRDLKPGQSQQLLDSLSRWLNTSNEILATIDQQLESVTASDAIYLSEKDNYDKTLELAKQEAGKFSGNRTFQHDMEGFEHGDDDRRFSGSKRQMKGRGRKH